MVLPWLWPHAGGPTPAVQPWLASAACASMLWLLRLQLTPRLVAMAWIAAATISAAMGLLQYFGVTASFHPWIQAAPLGEAYANLRQRNQFATLTNIGLAAVLWWAGTLARQARPVHRWWLVAAGVALALGNAASASRTGAVQLLLLAGLLALWGGWRQRWPRRIMLLALLGYGMASWALPLLSGFDPATHGPLSRLGPEPVPCGGRLVLWRNVLHLIGERPWFGWGWGELAYAHFITPYEGTRFCDILDNAHNLPLHLAFVWGVPAALALTGLLIAVVLRLQPWREQDASRQLAWAVLALILLHSLLEYPLWYGPFQMAVLLSAWLLRKPASADGQSPRRFASGRETALVCGLLAALAYAAWDYRRVSQIYLPPAQRAAAYQDQTLAKIRDSWLFREQVRFAEYTTTPLTPQNAEHLFAMGQQLLHFSPEARVVEKLIASALLLRREKEARFYEERFRAAYPQEHARWAASRSDRMPPPD